MYINYCLVKYLSTIWIFIYNKIYIFLNNTYMDGYFDCIIKANLIGTGMISIVYYTVFDITYIYKGLCLQLKKIGIIYASLLIFK